MSSNIDKKFCVFLAPLAAMPLLAVELPRSLAFAPGAVAICIILVQYFSFRQRPVLPVPLLIIVISGIALCGVSAAWAIAPEEVLQRVIKLLGLSVAGCALLAIAYTARKEQIAACAWLIPLGLGLAAALATGEHLLDAPLYRLMRETTATGDVNLHVFNRGVVTITLCFLPVFAFLVIRRERDALTAALVAMMGGMLLLTESQSAQLAMVVGLLTYFLFPYRSRTAWFALAAVTVLLILSAPFLAVWSFERLAGTFDALPFFGEGSGYAGVRMEIWDYVSRYALESPFLGYGLEATRDIKDFDSNELFGLGHSTLHPHNFALQLWLEFGVVGAVAGASFCGYLFYAMFTKLTPGQRRAALPTFVACLSLAATGYGMWQSWWVGLLFLVATFAILATKLLDDAAEPGRRHRPRATASELAGHSFKA